MCAPEQMHAELLSLMDEARRVCLTLHRFTEENQNVFSGEDEQRFLSVIKDREAIIDELTNLEYRIDLIREETGKHVPGGTAPHEVEEARQSIRKILDSVMAMDMKAMQEIGFKMQKYKDETLKARNKKHLSAYIKTNYLTPSGSSYDYKK